MAKITVQMNDYQITASQEYILSLPENSYLKKMSEWYEIGNVIYCSYWHTHDLVLDFRVTEYGTWEVKVIQCDVNGTPLPDKTERWHCTSPDKYDRIEININKLKDFHASKPVSWSIFG